MVFHSSLVASGLMPPQLRTEHVLPWRLRSYSGKEGRRSDMLWTEAATEADEEMTEEVLAVIVVAAVVVVVMGMMELSWPISKSSLMVDHCELIDEEDELRRIIVCWRWRIGGLFVVSGPARCRRYVRDTDRLSFAAAATSRMGII